MIDSKWVAPALLFFAGAVVGRVFGVRPLVKGALTAATVGGMLSDAGHAPARPSRAPSRKLAHRPARRRPAAKRSRAAA